MQDKFFTQIYLNKTRGSVAKAKVLMDITKPLIQSVWIGFHSEDDPNGDGKWQDIEYGDIPLYCIYCKHQGHTPLACDIKRQDDEKKKAKQQEEAAKKNQVAHPGMHTNSIHSINVDTSKNKQQPSSNPMQSKASTSGTTDDNLKNKTKELPTHQQGNKDSNDQWHTQKRKHFKGKS